MIVNKESYLALFFSLLLISFANPFYVWVSPAIVISIFFIISVINFVFIYNKINILKEPLILFFLLLIVYIFLPFRLYDIFSFYDLIFIFSCFIFLSIDKELILKIIDKYILLMCIISFLTIVSSLLFLLNFPFPAIQIGNENRLESVYLYYFSVYLDSQILSFGGVSLYRANGWFQEPGHFAVYLSVALVFIKNIFSSVKGKIIVLALLITFSATAYFLLFTILIFRYLNIKNFMYLTLFLIIFAGIYNIPFMQDLIDNLIISKFDTESVLDDRTKGLSFLDLSNLNMYFYGMGKGFLDFYEIHISDFRKFIVTSGYIGLIFLFLFYLLFLFKSIFYKNKIVNLMLLILLIVFIHRSWMFYQGFIWILFSILLVILKTNINTKSKF